MKISARKIILFLITLVFLYLIFLNFDFKELFYTIKGFDIKYLFFVASSVIFAFFCRACCFKQLISKTVNASVWELFPLCITGASLNIVLPARAGDIFRAYYVGYKHNVDKVKIFGTVMLERIFDGLVILSMLLLAIFLYNKNPLAQKLCVAASFMFFGSLLCAFLAIKYNKTDAICTFVQEKSNFLPEQLKKPVTSLLQFINKVCNSFVAGFEILKYPKNLIKVVIAASGIWVFECLKYFVVIQGFNCDVDWSVVLFTIPFLALACMIPSTSIFVGPYQLAVIAAFAIYGIPKETALAVSLVEQAVVTIITSVVAALFLIKNNISYNELKKDIEKTV